MKPYAHKKLQETEDEYTTTATRINTSTSSYKSDLKDLLESAQTQITYAQEAYESGEYYTSVSGCFVAGLYITYADNLLSYFEGQPVEDIFVTLEDYLNNLSEEIKSERPYGMTALQCIAAAQKRIFEAEDYLQQAYETDSDFDYIQHASYAQRRGETAEFWLNLARTYQKGDEITEITLTNAASSMVNTANLSLVYASSILPRTTILQEAEDNLEKAEREFMDTAYAASLFSALESKVYGEVALIAYASDTDESQRMERAKERASSAIETSRNQGIEPVLAVSYYELGESSGDSIQSLMYLRYAEEIASLNTYIESQPEMPVETTPKNEQGEKENEKGEESLLFLGIGICVGIGVSWVFRTIRS